MQFARYEPGIAKCLPIHSQD